MRSIMHAYSAVHSTDVKKELDSGRDQISEMRLTQLTDSDLVEVAEEILEGLFAAGFSVAKTQSLLEAVLIASDSDIPGRQQKIERLQEAFITVLSKVREKSARTAIESFAEYRHSKSVNEAWVNKFETDKGNVRLHESLVAQDRLTVKTGLLQMLEKAKAETPAAEEEEEREDDELFGSPNKKKAKKKSKDVKEDKKYGYDKKGRSLNPAAVEERKRKEDKLFGSPKSHNKSTSQGQRMGGKSTIYKEEEELQEKDTYDQVAAVIDKDRAKKGTDDATWDSLHGKKKQAKKERDYAAFEREKMKRDAQRSGHPWKHAKGSTTEKEGKPSEKTKHVRDPQYNSYEPDPSIERLIESGKFSQEEIERIIEVDSLGKSQVSESGWHRRNPEKVGTPADPDTPVLKGSGKVKTYAQTKKENPPSDPKKGGIYKPNKEGKFVKVDEAKAIGGSPSSLTSVSSPGRSSKSGKLNRRGRSVTGGASMGGMNIRGAGGLGKSKPEGDEKKRIDKYDKQVASDRKAAAKERAAMRKKGHVYENKAVDFIKQLVRENDAYKTTVANLKKEFGDGVLASKQDFEDHKKREAAKPKPKPQVQKPLTDAEKAQKEVDAQYGGAENRKKGYGLGS